MLHECTSLREAIQITVMEAYVRRSSSSTSLLQRREAEKKGFLAKTLERCWSLGGRRPRRRPTTTPPGCFVVLVGPERERFAVRAERANHPLFRALLDEAEAVYGFPRPATEPLLLPCAADEFLRVMSEVERDHHQEDDEVTRGGAAAAVAGAAALLWPSSPACSFFLKGGAARAGFQRMSPGRFLNYAS